jgi:hypothetical protein
VGLAGFPYVVLNGLKTCSNMLGADLDDWRTPNMGYLNNPSAKVDRGIRLACNYILVNGDLY